MKYYFEIQTGTDPMAGTRFDISLSVTGEKGKTEDKSIYNAAGIQELKPGQTIKFSIDFMIDAGFISSIDLTKDNKLLVLNGWLINYIKVSKSPIDSAQQISVFIINDWLKNMGEHKHFDVTYGYPYQV